MNHREQLEAAFSKTIENILESAGNTTAAFLPVLSGRSIELTVSAMEGYLKMLKELQHEYEKPASTNHSCLSPLLNDSMLIHRNRMVRSSKARLTSLQTSHEGVRCDFSPMEIDHSRIGAIIEESTLLDPSVLMDESTHQRGFLADVSDMNGTVRSRNPSFNFNYISPVSTERSHRSAVSLKPLNNTIDFDADVSSILEDTPVSSRTRSRAIAGEDGNHSIIVMNDDEMRTPRAHNMTIDLTASDETPTSLNLWNVRLRPGSNRKIDNEIRKEIQRQLARENPSDLYNNFL
ncbi:unnamed protein product [Caenorhabditis nigoni]